MVKSTEVFYFSPTGGTKRVAETMAYALADQANFVDLGCCEIPNITKDVVIFAAPVFGGRLPVIVPERLKNLNGQGKKAITIVVYGVRAYEDALLELNDVVSECGFQIVASAALIAQHSIAKAVGANRPDETDVSEIKEFAETVLEKIATERKSPVIVPGNTPYKDGMTVAVTPISLDSCGGCGACEEICPTKAVVMNAEGKPETALDKCMMCMACAAHCPTNARILPPPVQQMMDEKLGALKEVHKANEFFC